MSFPVSRAALKVLLSPRQLIVLEQHFIVIARRHFRQGQRLDEGEYELYISLAGNFKSTRHFVGMYEFPVSDRAFARYIYEAEQAKKALLSKTWKPKKAPGRTPKSVATKIMGTTDEQARDGRKGPGPLRPTRRTRANTTLDAITARRAKTD